MRSPGSRSNHAGTLFRLAVVASSCCAIASGFQQLPPANNLLHVSHEERTATKNRHLPLPLTRNHMGPLKVLLGEKTTETENENETSSQKTKSATSKNDNNQVDLASKLRQQDDDKDATTIPQLLVSDNDKMKLTMLALCWGVACLSALDRVAMSVAMVPLSAEYGYTDTMKGAISSLFSVGYGLGIIPAGILVATASPRVAMGFGIALWSLATIATPSAAAYSSMAPLLIARASVGAAESLVVPTLQRLLSSWTAEEEKSASLAKVFSGFHAGTVGAYILSPLVIDYLGDWRNIFFIYGGIGLFWLIPWLALSQDAPQVADGVAGTAVENKADDQKAGNVIDISVTKRKLDVRQEDEGPQKQWAKSIASLKEAPWGDFIRSKGSWAMLLAHCANNWGLYNTLAWSPTFYSEQYGLNVKDSALLSVLPSVAGAFGGLVAGSLADNLLKNIDEETSEEERERRITNIRKGFQGSALFVPALALFTLSSHIPEYPWLAQILLMGTTGFQAFNAAGYLAANQEKAGPKWAGLLYSVTSLPAVMTGTFGVYATGRVLDLTQQDWSLVFALNAGINLLGGLAFVALYNSKREFD